MGLAPPEPINDDEQYYADLGRFIVAHAGVENSLHELARKLSGLKDEKARVLFSGMSIGQVNTRTRALIRFSRLGAKTKANLNSCLDQMNVIGNQRDKMVHRDSTYAGGKMTVTNVLTSKSELEFERDQFTRTDLGYLYLDCLAINLRFLFVHVRKARRSISQETYRQINGPWQYIPPSPQTPKRRTTTQKIVEAL
jgi:hypothetical protein